MTDLEEIPTEDLPAAFTAAKVEAGAFLATNGLIVKAWRGSKSGGFEAAQKAIRMENSAKYLAPPSADLPTAAEREEIAASMRAIRDSLK